jgi:hypothetical protein
VKPKTETGETPQPAKSKQETGSEQPKRFETFACFVNHHGASDETRAERDGGQKGEVPSAGV